MGSDHEGMRPEAVLESQSVHIAIAILYLPKHSIKGFQRETMIFSIIQILSLTCSRIMGKVSRFAGNLGEYGLLCFGKTTADIPLARDPAS